MPCDFGVSQSFVRELTLCPTAKSKFRANLKFAI